MDDLDRQLMPSVSRLVGQSETIKELRDRIRELEAERDRLVEAAIEFRARSSVLVGDLRYRVSKRPEDTNEEAVPLFAAYTQRQKELDEALSTTKKGKTDG